MCKLKHCNGCPVNIQSEEGATINDYSCLPCWADAIKWYKETGKVWACHENPKSPCIGFLKLAKQKGEHVSVNRNTILITENTTIEQIYGRNN